MPAVLPRRRPQLANALPPAEKIVVAFVLTLATLGTCSLLLLCFLQLWPARWPSRVRRRLLS